MMKDRRESVVRPADLNSFCFTRASLLALVLPVLCPAQQGQNPTERVPSLVEIETRIARSPGLREELSRVISEALKQVEDSAKLQKFIDDESRNSRSATRQLKLRREIAQQVASWGVGPDIEAIFEVLVQRDRERDRLNTLPIRLLGCLHYAKPGEESVGPLDLCLKRVHSTFETLLNRSLAVLDAARGSVESGAQSPLSEAYRKLYSPSLALLLSQAAVESTKQMPTIEVSALSPFLEMVCSVYEQIDPSTCSNSNDRKALEQLKTSLGEIWLAASRNSLIPPLTPLWGEATQLVEDLKQLLKDPNTGAVCCLSAFPRCQESIAPTYELVGTFESYVLGLVSYNEKEELIPGSLGAKVRAASGASEGDDYPGSTELRAYSTNYWTTIKPTLEKLHERASLLREGSVHGFDGATAFLGLPPALAVSAAEVSEQDMVAAVNTNIQYPLRLLAINEFAIQPSAVADLAGARRLERCTDDLGGAASDKQQGLVPVFNIDANERHFRAIVSLVAFLRSAPLPILSSSTAQENLERIRAFGGAEQRVEIGGESSPRLLRSLFSFVDSTADSCELGARFWNDGGASLPDSVVALADPIEALAGRLNTAMEIEVFRKHPHYNELLKKYEERRSLFNQVTAAAVGPDRVEKEQKSRDVEAEIARLEADGAERINAEREQRRIDTGAIRFWIAESQPIVAHQLETIERRIAEACGLAPSNCQLLVLLAHDKFVDNLFAVYDFARRGVIDAESVNGYLPHARLVRPTK